MGDRKVRAEGKRFLKKIYNLFIWLYWVLVVACGTAFPDRRLNLGPLHWKCGV